MTISRPNKKHSNLVKQLGIGHFQGAKVLLPPFRRPWMQVVSHDWPGVCLLLNTVPL